MNELTLSEEEVKVLWNRLKNEYLPHSTDVVKLMSKISVFVHRVEKKDAAVQSTNSIS